MQSLILVLHILAAIAVIGLVLLQQGRGSDVGAAFGSGASNTMFGSASALPFLMKLTAVLAAVFFGTSILLSYLASHNAREQAAIVQMPAAAPAVPAKTTNNSTDADAAISFAPTVKK